MGQTINIFNCLWWLFVFGMFSIFLKMRVIGICSFWSFIRRFILHFWDFYQCRNIICSGRKISAILFLGRSFSGVTLIYEFELLVDNTKFLDKVEWPSIDCGERAICFGAFSFGFIGTSFLLMFIGLGIIKLSFVPNLVFN